MSTSKREGLVVVCTYRVSEGNEPDFELLLERHTPTLRSLGLITDAPVQVLRRNDNDQALYVEVFEWSNADAAERASQVPDVIAVWEPMAALCESRNNSPGLDFALFDRIEPTP